MNLMRIIITFMVLLWGDLPITFSNYPLSDNDLSDYMKIYTKQQPPPPHSALLNKYTYRKENKCQGHGGERVSLNTAKQQEGVKRGGILGAKPTHGGRKKMPVTSYWYPKKIAWDQTLFYSIINIVCDKYWGKVKRTVSFIISEDLIKTRKGLVHVSGPQYWTHWPPHSY